MTVTHRVAVIFCITYEKSEHCGVVPEIGIGTLEHRAKSRRIGHIAAEVKISDTDKCLHIVCMHLIEKCRQERLDFFAKDNTQNLFKLHIFRHRKQVISPKFTKLY